MASSTIKRQKNVQSGYVTFGQVDANSYKDIAVTFNTPYAEPPNVVVALQTSNSSYTMGNVSISTYDISTTGFKVRLFNARTAMSPAAYWIAVG